ncbi:MAG: aldehyde dehydrogenase family protein, partial [Caenispirillum sp.]|nr:aldehyde dehydrogenase family protein [Caenispirillum sp.]
MAHTLAYWKDKAATLAPEGRMFIDGRFVDAVGGGRFETVNPATGAVVAEVARGTAADVERAVASAH